jgi:hypothetical protein
MYAGAEPYFGLRGLQKKKKKSKKRIKKINFYPYFCKKFIVLTLPNYFFSFWPLQNIKAGSAPACTCGPSGQANLHCSVIKKCENGSKGTQVFHEK